MFDLDDEPFIQSISPLHSANNPRQSLEPRENAGRSVLVANGWLGWACWAGMGSSGMKLFDTGKALTDFSSQRLWPLGRPWVMSRSSLEEQHIVIFSSMKKQLYKM